MPYFAKLLNNNTFAQIQTFKKLEKYDVVVVGAGVAGLIAAGRAAEMGAKVLLLEKMERPGRKLLITGKGRCNITNDAPMAEFISHIHPNGKFLRNAFAQFFSNNILSLLSQYGVHTVLERGGRYFPESNKAADVLDALLAFCQQYKVDITCHCKVDSISTFNSKVQGVSYTEFSQRKEVLAEKVIVCTGGCSYPATGSTGDGHTLAAALGHTIVPTRPALVPIETAGNIALELQGLSLKNVTASVWVNGKKMQAAFGEMLFAHFGLTGPIILTLSRLVVDELRKDNNVELSIDLKPALDEQKLDERLIRDLNEHGKKRFDNIFREWLPAKMIPQCIEMLGIDGSKACHQVTAKERRNILKLLKDFRFTVTGHRSYKEAIITAGGVHTQEIDPKTMESKIVQGLFFAGELLDVDADTGGFNLQIAYSTAWLAGTRVMV